MLVIDYVGLTNTLKETQSRRPLYANRKRGNPLTINSLILATTLSNPSSQQFLSTRTTEAPFAKPNILPLYIKQKPEKKKKNF